MKLALYQGPSLEGADHGALAKIEQMTRASQTAGAQLVVFPELFLPGYNQPDLIRQLAQPRGGAWEKQVSAVAKTCACAIAFGWAERDEDRIYNTASVFGADGQLLARHRKLQLYGQGEQAIFDVGHSYTTFDLGGVKVGVLICYDVEFPHHVTSLADQGVDLIVVPTANPLACPNVPTTLVPARALENAITIAYANYCGTEGDLSYSGGSIIVGPDGMPLALAGGGEALLIAQMPNPSGPPAPDLSTQRQDIRFLEP